MASQKQDKPMPKRFEIVRGHCPSAAELAMAMVFRHKGITVDFGVKVNSSSREILWLKCRIVGLISMEEPRSVSCWRVILYQEGRRMDMAARLVGEIDAYVRTGFLEESED